MGIDRNNYEAWFLDHAERNLSSDQIRELGKFLEQNPDLREEFEEDLPVVPIREEEGHPQKESLKYSFSGDTEDDLLIGEMEGDLTSEEHGLLDKKLERSAAFVQKRSLYQKTRLEPESIIFPHKEVLKRRDSSPAVGWKRLAIAASILVAVFLTWFLINENVVEEKGAIAEKTPVEKKDDSSNAPPNKDKRDKKEEKQVGGTGSATNGQKEASSDRNLVENSSLEENEKRKDGAESVPPEKDGIRDQLVAEDLESIPAKEARLDVDVSVPNKLEVPSLAVSSDLKNTSNRKEEEAPGFLQWAGNKVLTSLSKKDESDGSGKGTGSAKKGVLPGLARIAGNTIHYKETEEYTTYGINLPRFSYMRKNVKNQ